MARKTRITPEQLAVYASAMCTQREVASIIGVTQPAICQMLKKPAYREAWDRAQDETRYRLRRAQIENALSGKTVDLIWLGKQYLEQRDSVKEIEAKTDVQITYIAEWGGRMSGQLAEGGPQPLPAGAISDDDDVIEGESEEVE